MTFRRGLSWIGGIASFAFSPHIINGIIQNNIEGVAFAYIIMYIFTMVGMLFVLLDDTIGYYSRREWDRT